MNELLSKEILKYVATALAGIGWAYQYYRKYVETSQLRSEKEEIVDERETIMKEKESYSRRIDRTREVIMDLQEEVNNGKIDQRKLNQMLDRLEEAILPHEEQVLSKLDRIQETVIKDE